MTDRYAELPKLLNHWLNTHDCYLVGSGAWWLAEGEGNPNDFDVIACEREHFNRMLRTLPESAEVGVNSMGGIKITLDTADEIDVWPHKLNEYFQQMARKNYENCVAVGLDPCVIIKCENI